MKILRNIAITLILVLALVLAAVIFYGGSLIKQGVEKVGPNVLGVPVTLESAQFYPLRGLAGLQGLEISNPEGYKSSHLMKLDGISVSINMASLKTDTVIIDEIIIEKPDISYEMAMRGNNFKALMKNLSPEPVEGEEPAEEPEEKVEVEPAKEGGKKVIIKHLMINDGVVRISSRDLGGIGTPIPLPTIIMKDIGADKESGQEGASIAQVVTEIFRTILRSVGSIATGTVDLAGKGVKAAGKGVIVVGGAAVDGASAVGGAAVGGASAVGGAAVKGASAVGGAAVGGASKVGGAAVDGVSAVGGAAAKGASAVGGAAVGGASKVGGAAVDGVSAVGGAVGSGVGAVGKGVGGLLGMGGDKEDKPKVEEPKEAEPKEEEEPREAEKAQE